MTRTVEERTRVGTPVDGVDVVGALSPSRAGDFKTCPLLYRFRTVDRLPEEPSPDAVRGTLVHKVLEDLFDLPAPERTPERAEAMIEDAWAFVLDAEPAVGSMFGEDGEALPAWLESCRTVLRRYFDLEDPRVLEPAERELYVEALLDSKLLLRGFVDRIEVAPNGAVRISDYKGLSVDTPLPTPDGWTTMADIQVGDRVVGTDGQPKVVTVKSDIHHRPCYRITFRDGSSVVCDNVHLWDVVTTYRQKQRRQVVDTDGLYSLHQQGLRDGRPWSIWVPAARGVDLPDIEDLPVDPWLLGTWLGDGDRRAGHVTVGRADFDDMLVLFKAHWPREVRFTQESTAMHVCLSKHAERCAYGHSDWRVRPDGKGRICARQSEHHDMDAWNVSFSEELRRAGVLRNKHIPRVYLRAGTQQRIELLRGLMDTDGWWNKTRRRAGFTTTDDRLAADVLELVRSLGITPQYFVKPYVNAVTPDRNWHIIEFTPRGFNPFSLPRKAVEVETVTELQRELSTRRIIASVEPVPSVPTQCIAVDAIDSLYLCGEGWVPTHNTGRAPGSDFEAKALFQMRFYALVYWRTHGVIPAMLRLIYLGNGEMVSYQPDEADLRSTEHQLEALWAAIRRAHETGDWRPRASRLCDWCSFQSLCPEFGGTPPPLPEGAIGLPVSARAAADPGPQA